MSMPIMVPIETAAEQMQAAPAQIRSLVALGATGAAKTANGDIIIQADKLTALKSILVDVANMNRNPIHVAAASEKYNIPTGTLSRWAAAGYIEIIGHDKNKTLLNEADIALISRIIEQEGLKRGQSLSSVVKRLTAV